MFFFIFTRILGKWSNLTNNNNIFQMGWNHLNVWMLFFLKLVFFFWNCNTSWVFYEHSNCNNPTPIMLYKPCSAAWCRYWCPWSSGRGHQSTHGGWAMAPWIFVLFNSKSFRNTSPTFFGFEFNLSFVLSSSLWSTNLIIQHLSNLDTAGDVSPMW